MSSKRRAVFEGITRHWRGSGKLKALVPGGLTEGRPSNDKDMPYARLTVTEGERESSSGFSLQKFVADIGVWSKDGSGSSAKIIDAIADHLDWAGQRTGTTAITVTGATVVHVRPLTGGQAIQGRESAQDVRLGGGQWEVLLSVTD